MKRPAALFTLMVFVLATSAFISYAGKGIEGEWEGTLEVQGQSLKIIVKIAKEEDGTLKATLDSPDQGAMDVSLDNVTFKNNTFSFDLTAAQGAYEGTLKESEDIIEGEWSQGGMTIPLILNRVKK
jgi:hypothetical protein